MGTGRGLYARDRRLHTVHNAVVAAVTARLGPLDTLNSVALPWYSATFEGVRHTLSFDRAALPPLNDLELAHPDHVVVSVGEDITAGRATLDILTIAMF